MEQPWWGFCGRGRRAERFKKGQLEQFVWALNCGVAFVRVPGLGVMQAEGCRLRGEQSWPHIGESYLKGRLLAEPVAVPLSWPRSHSLCPAREVRYKDIRTSSEAEN